MNADWKDIKTIPPPRHEPIVVYAKQGLFDNQDVYIVEFNTGSFFNCDVEGEEVKNVTHWDYLPEGPQS